MPNKLNKRFTECVFLVNFMVIPAFSKDVKTLSKCVKWYSHSSEHTAVSSMYAPAFSKLMLTPTLSLFAFDLLVCILAALMIAFPEHVRLKA